MTKSTVHSQKKSTYIKPNIKVKKVKINQFFKSFGSQGEFGFDQLALVWPPNTGTAGLKDPKISGKLHSTRSTG